MSDVSLVDGHIDDKVVKHYTVEQIDNKSFIVRHYINDTEVRWKSLEVYDFFDYCVSLEKMGYIRDHKIANGE